MLWRVVFPWFLGSLVLAQEQKPVAPVVLGVPAAFAEALRAPLGGLLGDTVAVHAIASIGMDAPADVEVFLLCDEWMLARLQARGVLGDTPGGLPTGGSAPGPATGSFVLSCTGECVIALGDEVDAAGVLPDTWDELALNPGLRDRFGIVAPEVDGTPWLLAMSERLARQEGDTVGKALWRTLDARSGNLWPSYAELGAAALDGRVQVAVGLRGPLAQAAERSNGRVRIAPLKGGHLGRFGVGVAANASANTLGVVRQLLQPETMRSLADAVGLGVLQVSRSPLDAAVAQAWWQGFETTVRGRGRSVEQLADWLDLGFGALLLVILWFLWRSHRRREAAPQR
jgi:hypothetical protein